MINKWFLGSLLVVLAFIGISLDQTAIPNQEIIIKFSNENVLQESSSEAITLVKSELEKINVSNIKIEEVVNGTLKITYYSEIDVLEVKKIFSKSTLLNQSSLYTSQEEGQDLPFDNEDIENYHLDIFKIQDSNDVDGQTGAIAESKSESTRFSSVNSYAYLKIQGTQSLKNIEKVAYCVGLTCSLSINNTSHKIPEVRAGPIS